MTSSQTEEEAALLETLEFLQDELEESKNFKVTNKYGGKGGFGLVLFVEDRADPNLKYAIKAQSIINTNTGKINKVLLKQCQDEAEILRNCKHKNIVEIHCDFDIGFYHYIQMKLCKCSLQDWISSNKSPINDMLFIHYVNQILDGIEYLHNLDYVLRDLSVRNILLTIDGTIKLCDFGLAKKYDDVLKSKILYTQTARGVYLYFPPELISDLNAGKHQIKQTKKGDLWAFGICLLILGGLNFSDLLNLQNNNYRIPQAHFLSENSNKLISFILNKDPEQRPSFQQIRDKIQELFFGRKSLFDQIDNQISEPKSKQNSQSYQPMAFKDTSSNSVNQQGQVSYTFNTNTQNTFPNSNSTQPTRSSQQGSEEQIALQKASSMSQMTTASYQFNFTQKPQQQQQQNQKNVTTVNFHSSPIQPQQVSQPLAQQKEFQTNSQKHQSLNQGQNQTMQTQIKTNQQNQINSVDTSSFDFDYNDIASLLKKYQNLLKEQPKNLNALTGLGYIAVYSQSNYEDARKYFESVIEIKQDHVDALLGLCICIVQSREMKNIKKALIFLNKCISQPNNFNWRIYYVYAWVLYFSNKKKDSLNYLNQALLLERQAPELLSLQLLLHKHFFNKIAEAKELALKIAKLNVKNHPIVFQRIGDFFNYSLGDLVKAPYYYKQSREINCQDLLTIINLSDCYLKNKNQIEGEELLTNAQIYYPQSSMLMNFLGQIEVDSTNKENIFKRALQFDPYNIWAYYNLGELEKSKNNFEGAIKWYEKVLEIDTDDETANFNIAKIYGYDLKEYEKSVQYFNNAILVNSNETEYYLSISDQYLNLKDTQSAENNLNNCLKLSCQSPKLFENLAKVEKLKGNYIKAAEYVQKQIELNPNDAEAYLNLGLLYHTSNPQMAKQNYFKSLQINSRIQNANYQIGILETDLKLKMQFYQAELVINPQNSMVINSIGCALMEDGKLDLALSFFDKGIKRDPNNFLFFKNKAVIYRLKDDFAASIEQIQKAIQLNPNEAELYVQLASIQNQSGNTDAAIQTYLQAIQINPSYDVSYFEIAQLYNLSMQYQLAQQYYEMYLIYQPQSAKCYYHIGLIDSTINKNNQRALQSFLQAINLDPQTDCNYYRHAGLLQHEMGYFKEAEDNLLKAISIGKNQEDLYKNLAFIARDAQKDTWKACSLMEKYLELFPNQQKEQMVLNEWYIEVKNTAKAREVYQKMIQDNGQNIQGYLELARLEYRLKNYHKSIAQYRNVLEIDPKHIISLYNIGLAYKQLQKYEQAVESFCQLIKMNQNFALAYYQIGEIEQSNLSNPKQAIKFLRQAIVLKNEDADSHFYLGLAFNDLDFQYEAVECFQKTLEHNPKYSTADFCRKYISEHIVVKKKTYKPTTIEQKDCAIF